MFLLSPENEGKKENDEKQKSTTNKEKKEKKTANITTGKQRHKPELCMYASLANAWI